ncbi:hypothetical protein A3Q56_00638 [Intoshia linei]|uniref:Uncharacterized protein n=1 Tax=Intoshia linei TaxID=1819745 RepID=A0A177BD84_9BILA|nr:hypothetical protein A3Q56_00638 [Intoshia linei]
MDSKFLNQTSFRSLGKYTFKCNIETWIEQFFSEMVEKNVYWFFSYNERTKKLYDAKSKSLIAKINSASKDDV